MTKRLTKDQKAALEAHARVERQMDRYMGSVFVTPVGQRDYEAKVQSAYEACKALGLGYQHGL